MVSHAVSSPRCLRGQKSVAQFRWHQLLGGGLAQWPRALGMVRGAFIRGLFDVTSFVAAGREATLAVRVSPQPHPGTPHEHTLRDGIGKNGGITAIDGPTFLCAIGWDWIPAIRDRNTGIWRGVSLSASGPVTIRDPAVTTDLPVPGSTLRISRLTATLANHPTATSWGSSRAKSCRGKARRPLPSRGTSPMPRTARRPFPFSRGTPRLCESKIRALWWPNGYGPQNLYRLSLSFAAADGHDSDHRRLTFGFGRSPIRSPDSKNLTLSVNGVPVFCRGGDWGMDEALKRIPFERLDAQMRMHRVANLNMIRNWVGQSTSEDLYDLCDRYGILLWDEFFQPNPRDGPNPTDIPTYLANVRDKILRFRNHPSIALWCGRNEGPPPASAQCGAAKADGRTRSDAPLPGQFDRWRRRPFRRPLLLAASGGFLQCQASRSRRRPAACRFPTLESIQGMMPPQGLGGHQ